MKIKVFTMIKDFEKILRPCPLRYFCLFSTFFTFSMTSAVRTGILWADSAWSINFFIISFSVVPVVLNEQSIPRSLQVNDTMFNPYCISRRVIERKWNMLVHVSKSSSNTRPYMIPILHFSGLIFIRLFRLGHWTWYLFEPSILSGVYQENLTNTLPHILSWTQVDNSFWYGYW